MIRATLDFILLFTFTHQLKCNFLIYSKRLLCTLADGMMNIKHLNIMSFTKIGSVKDKDLGFFSHHSFSQGYLMNRISKILL